MKVEQLFIQNIRNEGLISPELITSDKEMAQKIINHPGVNWAVMQGKKDFKTRQKYWVIMLTSFIFSFLKR